MYLSISSNSFFGVTRAYARITNNKISSDMQGLDKKFVGIEKIYKEVAM